MYYEATIKFKINVCYEECAQNIAQGVINSIKEYEKSAIIFVEKPELVNIEEIGINCHDCRYHEAEEQIIGDRGFGVETITKYYCSKTNEVIRNPMNINFCEDYEDED